MRLTSTDISIGGFGFQWSHVRTFANRMDEIADLGNGYNWFVTDEPYLTQAREGTLVAVFGATSSIWFTDQNGQWKAKFGRKEKLVHDAQGGIYRLVESGGGVFKFYDFEQPSHLAGKFKSYSASGGQTLVAQYNQSGAPTLAERTFTEEGETVTESLVYNYYGSGIQATRLRTITLQRQTDSGPVVPIRRASYSYYGETEEFGTLGDLKTAIVQEWDVTLWRDLQTSYYRYYKDGQSGGFEHGLRYALGPEAYERLADAVADPETATNQEVSAYADFFFAYDADRRVTQERVQGAVCGQAGFGVFTFAYSESQNTDDYNHWKRKTIETRPDGSEVVVYMNYAGQSMLRELRAGTNVWRRYYQFDSEGRVVLQAEPSAIASYDDTQANLDVVLRNDAGLIRLYNYYTTTGSGAAEGYLQHEKIKKGANGTPIKLRTLEYGARTADGVTVHPVTKETVYRDEAGTLPVHTSYSYEWIDGATQMSQRTTTLPAVSTDQNGSGSANTRVDRFNRLGYPTWSKDERGVITRTKYDRGTGALVQRIDDVNTSLVTPPDGWATVTGFGLHLVTDFEHDYLGRIIQELGPTHEVDMNGTPTNVRTAAWMVFKDYDHEVRRGGGYATGTAPDYSFTLINPVQIEKMDMSGRVTDSISATRADTSGKLLPSDTFPQSSWVRWTVDHYSDHCQRSWQRVYHTIPASGSGSIGTNFDQADFAYDVMGRLNRVKNPGGTITRTVFDVRELEVALYVGTDDTGATDADPTGGGATGNNMVLVASNEYDSGLDEGDGNLTRRTLPVDGTSLNDRVTHLGYDWRNRPTTTDGELGYFEEAFYDNLSRAVKVERRDGTITGTLLARRTTDYDDRGRVYRQTVFAVNPSTGTVGNSLIANSWYDATGNVIKNQSYGARSFVKAVYDGLNRTTAAYFGVGDDPTYADVATVTNNTVLEQRETAYDAGNNAIQSTARRRFHNATGLGALTSPGGAQPKARVEYLATWPDPIGRTQAVAAFGTNGGTALSRPATVPGRSDTVLVTSWEFNSAGERFKTIDPAGREDRRQFDRAGRLTETIDNWKATPSGSDESNTVAYTYTADGQIKTLTAKNATTGDQITQYVYGTTLNESGIARADLLRAEIYPDSDDVAVPLGNGPDGVYDRVEFQYNRQGEVTYRKDQLETERAFDYDKLGRLTHDRVTALGTNVDGAVRRVSRVYDSRGLAAKLTAYDHATVGSGNIVNEVSWAYNDFAQVTADYQAHAGAVDTSTTPKVQYAYADGTNNTIRQTGLTYPDGRVSNFDYGSAGAVNDRLGRVESIKEDSTALAAYQYLGLSGVVQVDYTQPDLRYDLATGGGDDPYDGLDRFGRVIDCLWRDEGSSTDAERIKYGYDRLSNRTWREVPLDPNDAHDECYLYDGMSRLTSFQRGSLNTQKTAISTLAFAQGWNLDATGNWSDFTQDNDGGGTWDLNQQRTTNKANEITAISETAGPSWADPSYNRVGNMTTIPKPADPTTTFAATYDAWNRLVKLTDGSNTIAEYSYDARHFRTLAKNYTAGVLSETRHHYYTTGWRLLEERLNTSTQPQQQYLWGLRYIDDLILRDRDTSDPADGTLNERLYALQDDNWNVTAITRPNGEVLERYTYRAYCSPLILTPNFQEKSTSEFDWQINAAGYRYLPHLGIYLVRYRLYHPKLGTWLTRDPVAASSIQNLYLYVGSNPVTTRDPNGLQPQTYGCCGPDVTDWFLKDLQKHLDLAKEVRRAAGTIQPPLISYLALPYNEIYAQSMQRYILAQGFAFQAKYLMAYKWMNFQAKGCATGNCKNTVMIGGKCLRKNQLGNIAFQLVGALLGPVTRSLNASMGYDLGSTYPSDHPHAKNYGTRAGTARTDNLAAFGVGDYMSERWNDSMDRSKLLQEALNSENARNRFKSLANVDEIGELDLSWVPEYDIGKVGSGFRTDRCGKCNSPAVGLASSSIGAFNSIIKPFTENLTGGAGPTHFLAGKGQFDQQLRETFENYTSSTYPVP